MADNAKKVLEIKNLDIGFKSPRGMVHAIRRKLLKASGFDILYNIKM